MMATQEINTKIPAPGNSRESQIYSPLMTPLSPKSRIFSPVKRQYVEKIQNDTNRQVTANKGASEDDTEPTKAIIH
jgi:hypothetical protein